MPFITFIYKIGSNNKTYYGKYITDYISDDHEGLDLVIKPYLLDGINKYRKQNNLKKLKNKIIIGIMSLSIDNVIPIDSTNGEIKCFDFYCENYNYVCDTFINGKKLL